MASTTKLADSAEDQDLLEQLLDSSKPALPDQTKGLHYLLSTPFRYPTRKGGSRFRAASDPGVFYGAETVRTACAELGYWRHKFLSDAVDLDSIEPVFHTAFETKISTSMIDLQQSPFDKYSHLWLHPTDYSNTQQMAKVTRESSVGAIVYRSVRDTVDSACLALLDPSGFSKKKPSSATQTWMLTLSKKEVVWRRNGDETLIFNY